MNLGKDHRAVSHSVQIRHNLGLNFIETGHEDNRRPVRIFRAKTFWGFLSRIKPAAGRILARPTLNLSKTDMALSKAGQWRILFSMGISSRNSSLFTSARNPELTLQKL